MGMFLTEGRLRARLRMRGLAHTFLLRVHANCCAKNFMLTSLVCALLCPRKRKKVLRDRPSDVSWTSQNARGGGGGEI